MAVTAPVNTNYLYHFSGGFGVRRYTDQAQAQTYDGEVYDPATVSHTLPTWGGESYTETDITFKDDNEVANFYLIHPPPYKLRVRIYEYDRDAQTAEAHWTGYMVRPNFDLIKSVVSLRCKTAGFMLDRESVSDPLSAVSRYSVFDERSGVDVEAEKISVVVTAFNDLRDILTVTGIAEIDDTYTGGVIVAPDGDERTVLKHTTEGADKKLYLAAAFSQDSLDTGSAADLYPGDDLTYDQWVNRWAAGQNFGGWPFTPNYDPAKSGIR